MSELVIDGAMVAAMLRSPSGPVGTFLIERGTAFQAAARQQLAASRKSGCLEDSIVKRFETVGGELSLRVVSDTSPCSPDRKSYSLFVHDGTQPHWIFPIHSDNLTFYWPNGPNGPGWYSFKSVYHPGTQPNRFFTDNLKTFTR